MIDYKSAGLTEEDLKKIYKWMDLGRKTDERLWLLNRAGKIPFVVSGQGQEATQIGMAYAMQKGDISSPYYRDLAFVTYMGISPLDTMLSAFGKRDDINSGGKQMPSHFSHKEKGILSQSSPVATQIPHSVGAALQYAAEKLSDRALGYGMHGIQVDGNDPIAVYKAMKEARERALAGEGPTLIEAVTSRMTPHSSDDDDTYRTKEERDLLKQEDCNIKFKTALLDQGIINENWLSQLEKEHKELINEATKSAEAAPYPSEEEALTYVYEEGGQRND